MSDKNLNDKISNLPIYEQFTPQSTDKYIRDYQGYQLILRDPDVDKAPYVCMVPWAVYAGSKMHKELEE